MKSLKSSVSEAFLILIIFLCAACGGSSGGPAPTPPTGDTDPPEVQLGERLFLETRFAQFFAANYDGDVNDSLTTGDPVMDVVVTTSGTMPGPFAGQSMNCRSCHFVDEMESEPTGGVRTYADFARHSPLPARSDGLLTTPRNSPPLVNASLERDVPTLFHFDGEFPTVEDLVIGTLTGRNFGWLPDEAPLAIQHVATVIRQDDGKNDLARSFGPELSYSTLLLGTSPSIPRYLLIPSQYRIDVSSASDDQVMNAIAALIHAYVDNLRFSTDSAGLYNGSPYDAFLRKNHLPQMPDPGESQADYNVRLLSLVNALKNPQLVAPPGQTIDFHNGQPFRFGATELQGMKTFFAQAAASPPAHTGNCVACHLAPNFTDFSFHNNGASQLDYDATFGADAFASLSIPDLAIRNANFDTYLPPSPAHPNASSRFRSPTNSAKPGFTDLGAWNIVGNPDIPNPQQNLMALLCSEFGLTGPNCNPGQLLPLAISYFKTPTVRDLGQSNPFFHTGALDDIDDVVNFYIEVGPMARTNSLRNASPELKGINIDSSDAAALSAFLNALNEAYN